MTAVLALLEARLLERYAQYAAAPSAAVEAARSLYISHGQQRVGELADT